MWCKRPYLHPPIKYWHSDFQNESMVASTYDNNPLKANIIKYLLRKQTNR